MSSRRSTLFLWVAAVALLLVVVVVLFRRDMSVVNDAGSDRELSTPAATAPQARSDMQIDESAPRTAMPDAVVNPEAAPESPEDSPLSHNAVVFDLDTGDPVPGALVRVFPSGEDLRILKLQDGMIERIASADGTLHISEGMLSTAPLIRVDALGYASTHFGKGSRRPPRLVDGVWQFGIQQQAQLTGLVVDEEGTPLEGVAITTAWGGSTNIITGESNWRDELSGPEDYWLTGPDGRFSLTKMNPDVSRSFEFFLPCFEEKTQVRLWPGRPEVVVLTRAQKELEVLVLDSNGDPVPGAAVTPYHGGFIQDIITLSRPGVPAARTGADGLVRVCLYEVEALRAEWTSNGQLRQAYEDELTAPLVVLREAPVHTIHLHGRIAHFGGVMGVPGVQLQFLNALGETTETITDAMGNYSTQLRISQHVLLEGEDGLPVLVTSIAPPGIRLRMIEDGDDNMSMPLPGTTLQYYQLMLPETPEHRVDFEASETLKLHGRAVYGEDSHPAGGATVLIDGDRLSTPLRLVTDGLGEFSFFPDGDSEWFITITGSQGTHRSFVGTSEWDSDTPKEFPLTRGATVSGTVLSTEGEALVGFGVTLTIAPGPGLLHTPVHTVSGEHGDFQFTDVPPGSHRLELRRKGMFLELPEESMDTPWWKYRAPQVQRIVVGNSEDPPPALIEVSLGAFIEGVVLDGDGNAIDGARIVSSDVAPRPNRDNLGDSARMTLSDAEGFFRIYGVPMDAPLRTLRIAAEGFQTTTLENLLWEESPHHIVLERE